MKKKLLLFILFSLVILDIRIVCQPEYDHYVIGHHLDDTCIVFSSSKLNAIWIGNVLYTTASEDEISNI